MVRLVVVGAVGVALGLQAASTLPLMNLVTRQHSGSEPTR